MTQKEIQQKSSEKIKQIMDLMKGLEVTVEVRERVDQQGFINKMVYWIDNEKYPTPEPEAVNVATGKGGPDPATGKGGPDSATGNNGTDPVEKQNV